MTEDKTVVIPMRQWVAPLGPDPEMTQRIPTLSPVVEARVVKSKKPDLETVLMIVLIWTAIAAGLFMSGLAYMMYHWIFGG